MRILIANDGFGDAGGVQSYLDAIVGGLGGRGHATAILHRDLTPAPFAGDATRAIPQFSVAPDGVASAIDRVAAWKPDVCFSHNMNVLAVDRALMARWPVVKFMHGYFGTCIGGQKRFGFPAPRPCDRTFGAACLAMYGARHCGEISPMAFVRHYSWANDQKALFDGYRRIVVASDHMRREYVRNGADPSRVVVNPLFATHEADVVSSGGRTVAFVGRMTLLKGGDLLIDAMAEASRTLLSRLDLLMIGDGPQRQPWEARAVERGVPLRSAGWVSGERRWELLKEASLLAVPSTWPEPFGLVGLEAAALGVPAVAFDVGGIREWLRPGVNGYLAPGNPPTSSGLAAALVEAFSAPDELRLRGCRALGVAREMSLGRHLDRLESVFASVSPQ